MRQISLDTETTGLDPASGHRIVEIGCVEMQSGIRTGKHYHIYLNPERPMPQEAHRIHGLSDQFLSDKPLFRQEVDNFLDFIADSELVIHNAGFDMKFINAELEKLERPIIPMTRAIDTVAIARRKFPGSPANLDALCRRFNIDLSARTYHGALLDAELLADVYLELIGGRQATLSLAGDKPTQTASQKQEKKFHQPRSFPPSEEERTAHRTFLQSLKSPLWLEVEQ